MLVRQLQDSGLVPITEVVSLEEAEASLRAAFQALVAAGEAGSGAEGPARQGRTEAEAAAAAQAEFDKWDTFIRNHPDHIERKKREAAEWLAEQAGANASALLLAKTFVPPNVWSTDLTALRAAFLEPLLAAAERATQAQGATMPARETAAAVDAAAEGTFEKGGANGLGKGRAATRPRHHEAAPMLGSALQARLSRPGAAPMRRAPEKGPAALGAKEEGRTTLRPIGALGGGHNGESGGSSNAQAKKTNHAGALLSAPALEALATDLAKRVWQRKVFDWLQCLFFIFWEHRWQLVSNLNQPLIRCKKSNSTSTFPSPVVVVWWWRSSKVVVALARRPFAHCPHARRGPSQQGEIQATTITPHASQPCRFIG
jgi:hypothetical protein